MVMWFKLDLIQKQLYIINNFESGAVYDGVYNLFMHQSESSKTSYQFKLTSSESDIICDKEYLKDEQCGCFL